MSKIVQYILGADRNNPNDVKPLVDEHTQPMADSEFGSCYASAQMLILELYRQLGRSLSQVKPSVVWRKYPENIPVFSDRTGGVCLYKPNEKGDKEIRCHSGNSLPIEDGDYYCYEADLISTIKE
jgi:hypothetical protein